MKLIIRIFNIVFMAISAAAIILLFAAPAINVGVNYKVTAEQIETIFKQTSSSADEDTKKIIESIDIPEALGGESIDVGLSLRLTSKALARSVNGDYKTVIDEEFVDPNVQGLIDSLTDPLHKIVKGVIKQLLPSILIEELDKLIEENKGEETRSAAELREFAGLNNAYFKQLSEILFNALDRDDATVDSLSTVLFDELSAAVNKLRDADLGFEMPEIDSTYKSSLTATLESVLDEIGLLKEDGEHIYSLNVIIDGTIVNLIEQSKSESGSGSASGETMEEKAARLEPVLSDLIKSFLTEDVYNTIGKVLAIIFFVLIGFAAIWAFLFIYTLFRTIFASKKFYTFTGPLFWIAGVIQLVLGVGITIATSIILNGNYLSQMGGEAAEFAKNLSISIITSFFVPSIFVLLMFPLSITYGVFKHKYKKQLKAERLAAEQPAAAEAK